MKQLHEYETQETDKLTEVISSIIIDDKSKIENIVRITILNCRDLERRLALCRDAIIRLLECISETRGINAYNAVENAQKALEITAPK